MFKTLLNAVRHKDQAVDPVTAQMSQAKQEHEVASKHLADTLCKVLDKDCVSLKLSK